MLVEQHKAFSVYSISAIDEEINYEKHYETSSPIFEIFISEEKVKLGFWLTTQRNCPKFLVFPCMMGD